MDQWILLGLVAGFFTTVGFLPQIVKAYRSKEMKDYSLMMPIMLAFGMFLWLLYGIVLNDMAIMLWNAAALALNLALILLTIRYRAS